MNKEDVILAKEEYLKLTNFAMRYLCLREYGIEDWDGITDYEALLMKCSDLAEKEYQFALLVTKERI